MRLREACHSLAGDSGGRTSETSEEFPRPSQIVPRNATQRHFFASGETPNERAHVGVPWSDARTERTEVVLFGKFSEHFFDQGIRINSEIKSRRNSLAAAFLALTFIAVLSSS
jgi:hypothetical protein